MRRLEIEAEREKLQDLLRDGEINDEVLVRVEHDLDLREARLDDHAMPAGEDKTAVPEH